MPPFPKDVDELKAKDKKSCAAINNAMLKHIWQELDYWLDVHLVTNGAHVKHLLTFHEKLETASFQNISDVLLYP